MNNGLQKYVSTVRSSRGRVIIHAPTIFHTNRPALAFSRRYKLPSSHPQPSYQNHKHPSPPSRIGVESPSASFPPFPVAIEILSSCFTKSGKRRLSRCSSLSRIFSLHSIFL